MEEMVNVYFYGKKYTVPAALTIQTAMEYAGYTLKRGVGCRHGFCGACATIYRIKGKNELKTGLACTTQVQEGMYITQIPYFPTDKRTYNIEDLKANAGDPTEKPYHNEDDPKFIADYLEWTKQGKKYMNRNRYRFEFYNYELRNVTITYFP